MASRSHRRAQRALLISGALTLLTIAGHTAGQGSLPDPVGLGLVAGLSYGLAYATSSARMGVTRLLALLLAGQALLHVVLTVSASHGHSAAAGTVDANAMVLGHIVAAILAAGAVVHADEAIERWLAFLSTLLGPAATIATAVPTGTARRAPAPAPASRVLDSLLRQASRRGPPVLAQPQPV